MKSPGQSGPGLSCHLGLSARLFRPNAQPVSNKNPGQKGTGAEFEPAIFMRCNTNARNWRWFRNEKPRPGCWRPDRDHHQGTQLRDGVQTATPPNAQVESIGDARAPSNRNHRSTLPAIAASRSRSESKSLVDCLISSAVSRGSARAAGMSCTAGKAASEEQPDSRPAAEAAIRPPVTMPARLRLIVTYFLPVKRT
jgi:hypothetical protein